MSLTIKFVRHGASLASTGLAVGVIAFGAVSLGGGASFAQEPQRGEPVADRARPDYDAIGMRLGSFIFLPKIDVSETYNDNIFSTQKDKDHDLITRVQPEIALESDWNNHALNFSAGSDVGRYQRSDSENYEDYNVSLSGQIDVRRDTNITAGISYATSHEDRGSPDDSGGISPTETSDLNSRLGVSNKWNRVTLDVGLAAVVKDYDDVGLSGGTISNNDDRDRKKYTLSTRLGYEIVPAYEGFVTASYNKINYDSGLDDAGVNRDSDGYAVTAGTRIDLSGSVTGDVSIGYLRQDYDDATLENITGPTVGAALTWNVTNLTTLKGSVDRTISQTTQAGASGSLTTKIGGSVDHELRRNVLLGGNLSGSTQKYRGNGREDDLYVAGAYARYLLNRSFNVSANYDFSRKNSNAANSSYSQNVFLIRLTAQY
jgi:hypothetical protein